MELAGLDSGQGVRYLIKWCGLPYCESTWERAVDLHDKDLETHIQLYTQRQVHTPLTFWLMSTPHGRPSFGWTAGCMMQLAGADCFVGCCCKQGFPTMNHSPVLPVDPSALESKEASPQGDTTEEGADEGKDAPHTPSAAAAGKMTQPVFKGGGQLRDYQWEAVLWLVHNWKLKKGSILADEVQRPVSIVSIWWQRQLKVNRIDCPAYYHSLIVLMRPNADGTREDGPDYGLSQHSIHKA